MIEALLELRIAKIEKAMAEAKEISEIDLSPNAMALLKDIVDSLRTIAKHV